MRFGVAGRTPGRVVAACLLIASVCGSCRSSEVAGPETRVEVAVTDPTRATRLRSARDWINANAPAALGVFRVYGASTSSDYVSAHLRADQEKLAASLAASYGDAIRLKVGMFDYPLDRSIVPVCRKVALPSGELRSLSAAVVVTTPEVKSGGDLAGKVVITNNGRFSVSYTVGVPLAGVVVRRDTDDVVGVWDGAIVGAETSVSLVPGESKELGFVGGTASCYPSIGYSVPTGDYDVVVESLELRNTLGRVVGSLAVEPAPITIVASNG